MDIQKTTIQKLLTHCKQKWVQWVIGAVIGALAAAGVITVTGCTVTVDPGVLKYVIDNPIDKTGK